MTYDPKTRYLPPAPDPRVFTHPFVGNPERFCDLPGCNRDNLDPLHDVDSTYVAIDLALYLALVEAAKAVGRATEAGLVVGTPGHGGATNSLILLDQALDRLGYSSRAPRPSERAMAAARRPR